MEVEELDLKKFSRYDFNSVDLILYFVLSSVTNIDVPAILSPTVKGPGTNSKNSCEAYPSGNMHK